MVDVHWNGLEGKELRYRDQTWELSGDVEVLEDGSLLAVEANEAEDVRHRRASLYFGVRGSTDSLNPGALGEHFEQLERTEGGHAIVVRTDGKTYRYELQRLEYE